MAIDAGLPNGEEDFVWHAGIEKIAKHRQILDGVILFRRLVERARDE
jgi:hypothetical protein